MPDAAIGGKAAGLLRIHAAGGPVPPWVVIPAGEAARCRWQDDDAARETLAALFAELSPHGEGVAVRSSGLSEDQAGASAAGIYESVFCASAGELAKAIDTVLRSAIAKRASAYRCGDSQGNMAVILQRRITPILSGVAFSAHPGRACYDRVLIEAVYGDSAALVEGSASPSRFELELARGELVAVEAGPDGPATLDNSLATALLSWLLKLEDVFDAALDIEWAADASGLWLLQARPITRLALDRSLLPPAPATSWFFDQRFHEPIHPITRTSLLPLILRTGVEEALRMRGMAVPEPLDFDYAGQVYVPLEAYHRLLRNLPGWLLTPDLRQLYPEGTPPGRLPGLGLVWTGLPVLWRERARVLGNVRAWGRFRDGLAARLAAIPEPPAEEARAWRDAWQELDLLTEEFLSLHRWSIVLADYAYNAFLLITSALPRSLRVRLRQRLLRQVRLITSEANTAREAACHGDQPTRATFLRAWGHRSASLDYAAPTWAEMLPRARIETEAASGAKRVKTRNHSSVLVRLVEMREEQRFHWERILARQRALLLSAGQTLHGLGLLDNPEDVWWIEWGELLAALEHREIPVPARIQARRRRHRINVPVRRPTHLRPADESAALAPESGQLRGIGASPDIARGTALVFRQLKDLPETLPDGTILVLPCLDPAWTPVLKHVAGLVIERGGLLSHAAIIAREYGVPLVIGVPDATERIKTGDAIRVDGDRGEILFD